MPTRPKRSLFFAGVAGLVFLSLAGALIPGGLELRITPVKGGRSLAVVPLRVNERFTIRYYHSVENAPIWETHSVDGSGRIYIEEERYVKFGAGMGHMPGFGRMVHRGPYEVIENMHMPTGDFVLRIGSPGVNHTLIWRGIERNLSAVAPHVAVRFHAQPVSLLYRLWRNLFPHPATPSPDKPAGGGQAGIKQMSKLKCQMKSKWFNAKTYPAYMSAAPTGDLRIHNSGNLAQFSHLIFDIDLTFGFWNLTLNSIPQKHFCTFIRER